MAAGRKIKNNMFGKWLSFLKVIEIDYTTKERRQNEENSFF